MHFLDEVGTVNSTEPAGCPGMNRAPQEGYFITGKLSVYLKSVIFPQCLTLLA